MNDSVDISRIPELNDLFLDHKLSKEFDIRISISLITKLKCNEFCFYLDDKQLFCNRNIAIAHLDSLKGYSIESVFNKMFDDVYDSFTKFLKNDKDKVFK